MTFLSRLLRCCCIGRPGRILGPAANAGILFMLTVGYTLSDNYYALRSRASRSSQRRQHSMRLGTRCCIPIVMSVGLIPQKEFDLSSLAIDPPLPPCCASTYTIGPTGNLRLFFYNAQYTTVGLQSCIVLGVLHAF